MGVEHVSFPSIEQYRNVCKLVRERAQHDGLPLPRLTLFGSVKLHGTNAGIGFTEDGEMWAQSRSLIVTQHRLEKKLDDMKEQGLEVDIKNTGTFLKIVTTDVMKEEADTIAASGLPQTDVMRGVAMKAKQFFMETVNAIPL
jgi:hypothetical protein